jgi:hypothetical protein
MLLHNLPCARSRVSFDVGNHLLILEVEGWFF